MKRLKLFLSVLLLLLSIAWFAPGFLMYSDRPTVTDAVVLFVGPGFEDRQQEACSLIVEYRPKFLIIPAYNMVTTVDGAKFSRIRRITNEEFSSFKARKARDYEAWYEDTHVEVMETKRLMEASGVHSAIFVSSPYHMRRIKLISNRLFNTNTCKIHFVPSRREVAELLPWHLSLAELYWQASEYAKITWYILYQPFVSSH